MRIAVTGSNGFIGRHLVALLKAKGYSILEVSRKTGYDLLRWETLRELGACDYMIHLAARTYVPDSFENPRQFFEENLQLTNNALELAKSWKAKFILMGSYLYGPPAYIPIDELHPLNPHNPYAYSKYISEILCEAYHKNFGLPVLNFRLFNVYGPGQQGKFLIPEIMEKIQNGGPLVLKDPRPKRDYIHVSDVVDAINSVLDGGISFGFENINLGTGVSVSVEELLGYFRELHPGLTVEFTNEYRTGEVLDSVADIRKAYQLLGWKPSITLREGLKTLYRD